MSAFWLPFLLLATTTALATGKLSFIKELGPKVGSTITNENCVCSPVSVRNVLTLLYFGTRGEISTRLKSVLEFQDTKPDVAKKLGRMIRKIEGERASFHISDRLYIDQRLRVLKPFTKLSEAFGSEVVAMQSNETSEKKQEINSWVEQLTANKIHELINDLPWDANIVTVNEIYFKAKWLHPFPKERTFSVENNETHNKFDMMVQDGIMMYAVLKDLKAYAAQLKLQGTDISMLVLQPRERGGLAALEEALSNVDLTQLPKSMSEMNVTLVVPKFRFQFDLPLNPTLRQFGLKNPSFNHLLEDDMNLDGSDMAQRSIIEITETGVEAACVTGIGVHYLSTYHNITANRQFFFALIDEENVYFAGHVANM